VSVPPRLKPLLAQFDFARERLLGRLEGLSDAEYFWEPAPGCWSVRRRGEQRTSASYGREWVLEYVSRQPDPGPLTTIAWRMCHLAGGLEARADYTIGTKALAWEDREVAGNAAAAITNLERAFARWRDALVPTTDADLDEVGRSSLPWGLDPGLPFLDICWWVNQEVLHHGGEIALLRDLYAAMRP
jgi:hypothetical protein